mmetsp:Transcript_20228/g.26260  ORF Transcript_20228/g.26260 Transcript_20228/m.26260 type:complete len:344 (+) Transcript_20228:192-1223(+)
MTNCETLFPASTCGMGRCINSSCICFEGWEQTEELSYFVDEETPELRMCNFNRPLTIVVYMLVFFSAVTLLVARVLLCWITKNSKHARRGYVTMTGCMLLIIMAVMRLTDPDALFGVSFPFTFCFAMNTFCFSYVSVQSQNAYLRYLTKSFPSVEEELSRKLASTILEYRITKAVQLLGFIVLQFFWISIYVEDQFTALVLVRTGILCLILIYMYMLIILVVTKQAVRDMETLLVFNESTIVRKVSQADMANRLNGFLEREIPKAKKWNYTSTGYCVVTIVIFMLPLFSNFWLRNWMYIHFSTAPLYAFVSAADAISKFRKRNEIDRSNGDLQPSNSAETPSC